LVAFRKSSGSFAIFAAIRRASSFVSNFEQGTTTVGPQFMSHDDVIENRYLRSSNYLLRGPGSGYCEEGSDSLRVWPLLADRCRV
jgi:hypothetical protein